MRGSGDPLRVLIATPLGRNGKGGIDRITDRTLDVLAAWPEERVEARHLTTRGPGSILFFPLYFAHALFDLWRARLSGKVDLLHIQLSVKGSTQRKIILSAWARRLGVPYIVHLHGPAFGEYWDSAPAWVGRGLTALFEGSETIIVMGKVWADVIGERLPHTRDKITILPNATAAPAVHVARSQSDPRTHIVFLGEVGPRKGAPQLIDALALLRDRTDWRATMAGNGALDASRTQARAGGVEDRVVLPGWLETAGASKLLAQADIFVLPSFAENQPLSVLEALGAGAAVIATPVGAVPDIIDHGRNGFLTPAGDVPALAKAIEVLLDNPTLRQSMGAQAQRDHAQRYTMKAHVTRLLEIWRAAIGAHQRRPIHSKSEARTLERSA